MVILKLDQKCYKVRKISLETVARSRGISEQRLTNDFHDCMSFQIPRNEKKARTFEEKRKILLLLIQFRLICNCAMCIRDDGAIEIVIPSMCNFPHSQAGHSNHNNPSLASCQQTPRSFALMPGLVRTEKS